MRGYPTLTVIAVIPGYRGILYQHVFSSAAPGFQSVSLEIQRALTTVGADVAAALPQAQITWIMDRGFDDIAVWRTIWAMDQHLVCWAFHDERVVARREHGEWVPSTIGAAVQMAQR